MQIIYLNMGNKKYICYRASKTEHDQSLWYPVLLSVFIIYLKGRIHSGRINKAKILWLLKHETKKKIVCCNNLEENCQINVN